MTEQKLRALVTTVETFEQDHADDLARIQAELAKITDAQVDQYIAFAEKVVTLLPIPAPFKAVVLAALPIIGAVVKMFTQDN